MDHDVAEARKYFTYYRSRGFNPLPSDPTQKKPLVRFKHLWEEHAPYRIFDDHPTSNLQVMTGRHWRLLVIDLDGPEAQEWWIAQPNRTPRTWIVHSGGNGMHLWFRLPGNLKQPLPFAVLWKGDGKHKAVERLCDHRLVMAPPSIHPVTKEPYRFLDKDNSPKRLALPTMCPQWVLDLKPIEEETKKAPREYVPIRMDGVPDKVGLARSWGLRIASNGPDRQGFWVCHAIDREDRTPSASFNENSGYYIDHGRDVKLSFVDLALALRVYSDVKEALTDLGIRSGQRRVFA